MKARLTGQLEALDKRIAELEKLPVTSAGWELKDTGSTFKSVWDISSQDDRRQLLLRSGIRFKIQRISGTQAIQSELYVPEEIQDLLNAKKPLPKR
jgi:hypothetical protein